MAASGLLFGAFMVLASDTPHFVMENRDEWLNILTMTLILSSMMSLLIGMLICVQHSVANKRLIWVPAIMFLFPFSVVFYLYRYGKASAE